MFFSLFLSRTLWTKLLQLILKISNRAFARLRHCTTTTTTTITATLQGLLSWANLSFCYSKLVEYKSENEMNCGSTVVVKWRDRANSRPLRQIDLFSLLEHRLYNTFPKNPLGRILLDIHPKTIWVAWFTAELIVIQLMNIICCGKNVLVHYG